MQNELNSLVESGEPVVIVVLSERGLERAFVFYPEGDPDALEMGNQLLARVSTHLILLDSAVKSGGVASEQTAVVVKE